MLDSKYIAYFLGEVTDWQQKLSNADAVINAWFQVQRAWMHLESIFIGSEDIRNQLPEESKRFEKIDKDFKVISNQNPFYIFLVYFFKDAFSSLERSHVIQYTFAVGGKLIWRFSLQGSIERNVEQLEHSEVDE